MKPAVHALFVIACAAFCSAAFCTVAPAAEPRPVQITLNIEAQPMEDALNQFAQQSGLQILISSDDAPRGLHSPRIVGKYNPADALAVLLEGTGLMAYPVNENTYGIRPAGRKPIASVSQVDSTLRLAQGSTDPAQGMQDVQPSPFEGEGQGEDSKKEESSEGYRKGIPEILVTGSRSKSLNADIERTQDDIQPYVVLGRKEIERSAAKNVEDLLRSKLTMNYVASSLDQSNTGRNTSTIALRGLSSGQTLILIDGRRVSMRGNTAGQSTQGDLNAIPLSAIERIEILPATASGIYGGGATGGVVNVVLRRDYSGIESTLTYENSFDGGGALRRLDLGGGFALNGGKTSVMLNGSYGDRSELLLGQRDFTSEYLRRVSDNQRRYNLSGYLNSGSPPVRATTNISSVPTFGPVPAGTPGAFCTSSGACFGSSAPNLTLKPQYGGQSLGSPITYVPTDYTGLASAGIQGFVQNAGNYNLELADTEQSAGRNSALLNDPSIYSLSMSLRQILGSKMEAFFTASASENKGNFQRGGVASTFTMPTTAPNNPFQQAIRVSIPVQLSGDVNAAEYKTTAARVLAGVKVDLPKNWGAMLDYSLDRSDYQSSNPAILSLADSTSAIASGSLNVLVAPPPGGFDLSQYIIPGSAVSPSHAILKVGSLRIAGPVLSLPAGPLVLTTLLEYDQQSYSEITQGGVNPFGQLELLTLSDQSSTTKSVYAEAQIPIVSEAMKVPALQSISLQIAGRYDSYRNIGSIFVDSSYDPSRRPRSSFNSSDPTFGLRVQVLKSMAFRASYGTGFYPPGLDQLRVTPPQFVNSFLIDPKRGNQLVGNVIARSGGNTGLKPEHSKSRSLGVILTPLVDDLRLSFDWTRIEKRDNISNVFFSQPILGQEDALPAGVIVRSTDPSTFGGFGVGPILELNSSSINATSASSESYDLACSYLFRSERFGEFEFYSNASRLVHYKQQLFPTLPETEYSDSISYPSWQANASLTWSWKPISATWSTRYLDSAWLRTDHSFSSAHGGTQVSAGTVHDIALEYRFDSDESRPLLLSGGNVQFGVKNIFNTKPRFNGDTVYGYDFYTSPMLATYYLSLTARF